MSIPKTCWSPSSRASSVGRCAGSRAGSEHLMARHSRDQLHDVEVGFDDDGRILAFRDDYIVDCGAWNPIGVRCRLQHRRAPDGPLQDRELRRVGRIVVTNKVPNAPYRGAGRPEAAFAMERTIDLVARTLGLEPAEVRRRNMIRADEMPYKVGIPYRDGEPIVYDSGDYPGALQKALAAIGGVEAFRRRQAAAREQRPLSRARHRLLYRGHRGRAVRERLCPHRPVRQDLRLVRRLPAGPGDGDDFLPGRRRPLEGRAGGRRSIVRRHVGDRDRLRHDGEPQHGNRLGGDARGERAACARRSSPSPPICWNARRPISNCATAASASSACPAPRSAAADRRRRRGRAGRTRARQGSMPGWRRPFTGSLRPSPGATRCTRRLSRSTSRPAA